MSDDFHKEINGSKGRYVLTRNGLEAELTFSVLSERTVIADHTDVPEGLRGTGAGAPESPEHRDGSRVRPTRVLQLGAMAAPRARRMNPEDQLALLRHRGRRTVPFLPVAFQSTSAAAVSDRNNRYHVMVAVEIGKVSTYGLAVPSTGERACV